MVRPVVGAIFGRHICDALGIDGDYVTKIRIVIDGGPKPVLVQIEKELPDEEAAAIKRIFSEYRIMQRSDAI